MKLRNADFEQEFEVRFWVLSSPFEWSQRSIRFVLWVLVSLGVHPLQCTFHWVCKANMFWAVSVFRPALGRRLGQAPEAEPEGAAGVPRRAQPDQRPTGHSPSRLHAHLLQ